MTMVSNDSNSGRNVISEREVGSDTLLPVSRQQDKMKLHNKMSIIDFFFSYIFFVWFNVFFFCFVAVFFFSLVTFFVHFSTSFVYIPIQYISVSIKQSFLSYILLLPRSRTPLCSSCFSYFSSFSSHSCQQHPPM